jgi:hypothetical protein
MIKNNQVGIQYEYTGNRKAGKMLTIDGVAGIVQKEM